MILIGSKAIQYHINSWRAAADTDFVGTYEEVEQHRKKQKTSVRAFYPISNGASFYMSDIDKNITELEVAWEGSRAEKLVKFVEAQQDNVVHALHHSFLGCSVHAQDVPSLSERQSALQENFG